MHPKNAKVLHVEESGVEEVKTRRIYMLKGGAPYVKIKGVDYYVIYDYNKKVYVTDGMR